MSLWSWQFWQPLWPAVFCWLFIALPSLAWAYPRVRGQELLKLPWPFTVLGWLVIHCWPYSKVARISVRFAQWDQRLAEDRRERRCRACGRLDCLADIDRLLTHFPGEDDHWQRLWYTPPRLGSQEEADRWLAARQATGEGYWE